MKYTQTSLFNSSYLLSCLCNLVFCMSFHMLLPVMPLYLTDGLGLSKSMMGIILAMYPLAALGMRLFSGYIVDSFERKPVFIWFMIPFMFATTSYIFVHSILLIAFARFMHGASYGAVQTSLSTMAVDAMPQNKIGTGVGLFGTINSLSMALGPMLGMMVQEYYSFQSVFIVSSGLALGAFCIGLLIKTVAQDKKGVKPPKIELDSLILKKGVAAALCFFLMCFASGLMMNFISLHALAHGVTANAGLFFTFHAAGLILSRLISGRLLDKGYIFRIIQVGKIIIFFSFIVFVMGHGELMIFGSGFVLGIGYGLVVPSYQMLLIFIARPDQRGTANSTYFLTWDIGIGSALLLGGFLADFVSLDFAYMLGTAFVGLSFIIFMLFIRRAYAPYLAAMRGDA